MASERRRPLLRRAPLYGKRAMFWPGKEELKHGCVWQEDKRITLESTNAHPFCEFLAFRVLPLSRCTSTSPAISSHSRGRYTLRSFAIRLRARLIRCPALAPCAVGRSCVCIRS